MKKLLFVFGTRPEAIKMLPIIMVAKKDYSEFFDVKICVTAQHRQMLDQVLEVFDVKPDFDLNIMSNEQDLYNITSRVLLELKVVLAKYGPDFVIVHGDTTTTFSASLAAFYQKIPVAHIEAGLRTHNIYSPWPEEINRSLTSCIAKYHFAPTLKSKENLLKENIVDNVFVVGNTVIDSLFWMINKLENNKILRQCIIDYFADLGVSFDNKKIILVTGHRRENFGDGFINICQALKLIANNNPDVHLIYPVHLNPSVQKPVYEILSEATNIHLIEPVDYPKFVYLMQNAYIIITDSGGIQEEAPSLKKPVLVTRDATERPEALAYGSVKLVGTNKDLIVESVETLLNDKDMYNQMIASKNPYGDGESSRLILDKLI